MIGDLRSYLIGWRGYFGFCQTPSVLRDLDQLASPPIYEVMLWKQWKTGKRRFKELRQVWVSAKTLPPRRPGAVKGIWHQPFSSPEFRLARQGSGEHGRPAASRTT